MQCAGELVVAIELVAIELWPPPARLTPALPQPYALPPGPIQHCRAPSTTIAWRLTAAGQALNQYHSIASVRSLLAQPSYLCRVDRCADHTPQVLRGQVATPHRLSQRPLQRKSHAQSFTAGGALLVCIVVSLFV